MTARLADLVTDDANGKLSSRKLWYHLGNAAATAAFLIDALGGHLDEWKLTAYLVGVTGGNALLRLVELKYGNKQCPEAPDAPNP